mmetsp:Transcript_53538/g.170312  ORF Transcript_53538/g.170312 Transcript_53538/m.170312 type:complete len:269 (-) Transcript_53538:120-926(-)
MLPVVELGTSCSVPPGSAHTSSTWGLNSAMAESWLTPLWRYHDLENVLQGPFSKDDMWRWWHRGFFLPGHLVRSDAWAGDPEKGWLPLVQVLGQELQNSAAQGHSPAAPHSAVAAAAKRRPHLAAPPTGRGGSPAAGSPHGSEGGVKSEHLSVLLQDTALVRHLRSKMPGASNSRLLEKDGSSPMETEGEEEREEREISMTQIKEARRLLRDVHGPQTRLSFSPPAKAATVYLPGDRHEIYAVTDTNLFMDSENLDFCRRLRRVPFQP